MDIAENNSFGINCCAEEGGSHRSHVADRRRIVYHYPWGSYRVDFQRRSGVFQQRAVLNHSAVNPDFSLLSSMGKSQDFASEFNFFEEENAPGCLTGFILRQMETVSLRC